MAGDSPAEGEGEGEGDGEDVGCQQSDVAAVTEPAASASPAMHAAGTKTRAASSRPRAGFEIRLIPCRPQADLWCLAFHARGLVLVGGLTRRWPDLSSGHLQSRRPSCRRSPLASTHVTLHCTRVRPPLVSGGSAMPGLRRTLVLSGLLAVLLLNAGCVLSKQPRSDFLRRRSVGSWWEVAADSRRGVGVVHALGMAVHRAFRTKGLGAGPRASGAS